MEITPEFSAALVMVGTALGAGYAIAITGAAAAGATVEKPEVGGKVLILVALGEALAIYGLVVALMILMR